MKNHNYKTQNGLDGPTGETGSSYIEDWTYLEIGGNWSNTANFDWDLIKMVGHAFFYLKKNSFEFFL